MPRVRDRNRIRVPLRRGGALLIYRCTVEHWDEYRRLFVDGFVKQAFTLITGEAQVKVNSWDAVDLAFQMGRYYPAKGNTWYRPDRDQQRALIDPAEDIPAIVLGCLNANGGEAALAKKWRAFNLSLRNHWRDRMEAQQEGCSPES